MHYHNLLQFYNLLNLLLVNELKINHIGTTRPRVSIFTNRGAWALTVVVNGIVGILVGLVHSQRLYSKFDLRACRFALEST